MDELRKAYVDVLHARERDVEDMGGPRNVDAWSEEEELHGDANSVGVEDMEEVDIHHEVQSYTLAHDVTHSSTFLDLEVALLRQLAYSPRVPSQDAMKDSMEFRDEDMTWEGISEWLGAYYQWWAVSWQRRPCFSASNRPQDHHLEQPSVSLFGHRVHRCGLANEFFLLISCLFLLHPDLQ